MSDCVSIDEVVNCTLKAITNAHNEYFEWSDGEWLWNAHEYFLTVRIAESIVKLDKKKFVTMEDNVDYILGHAKAKGSGKMHSDIRKNGRFDIVLWLADGITPRAVIEVKNSVNVFSKIEQDVKRIREVIRRKATSSMIEFGIIAFYISQQYKQSAKEQLQKQIDNIFDQVKETVGNSFEVEQYGQDSISCDDDQNAFCPVVFLIKK
jgi:hypothetical protein